MLIVSPKLRFDFCLEASIALYTENEEPQLMQHTSSGRATQFRTCIVLTCEPICNITLYYGIILYDIVLNVYVAVINKKTAFHLYTAHVGPSRIQPWRVPRTVAMPMIY